MNQGAENPFQPVVGSDGQLDFEVGLAVLCLWADCSDETILKLARSSVIPRYGKGRYRLRESLVALSRWRQDEQRRSSKSAASSRVSDRRADEIEMRIEEKSRALVKEAVDEALAIVDEFAGGLRSDILSIGARVTKDIPLRRRIETEVNDAFGAAARRAAAARARSAGDEPGKPQQGR